MPNKELLIVIITGLIFFLIGILCILFPQWIQQIATRVYSDGKGLLKFNPLIEWIKTPKYILSLRVIGIISLSIFGLMIYLILLKYV
jgi:hypothetical protein